MRKDNNSNIITITTTTIITTSPIILVPLPLYRYHYGSKYHHQYHYTTSWAVREDASATVSPPIFIPRHRLGLGLGLVRLVVLHCFVYAPPIRRLAGETGQWKQVELNFFPAAVIYARVVTEKVRKVEKPTHWNQSSRSPVVGSQTFSFLCRNLSRS